jgi:RNA polymerase sigma factor (sigma-70 family)
MSKRPLGEVVRHVRELFRRPSDGPDGQLLTRYARDRDEEAFAAIVRRHGPLVLNVCRSVLHHHQDAEDAFQATFLVLARRADSIRKGEAVGSWLYGVAHRTACRALRAALRRRRRETRTTGRSPESPASETMLRELQAILHEEVQGLSARLRAPFVLCCLEGKSRAEAAQELGVKEGTVSSRIDRARQRLQQRLAKRGITLAAALAACAVAAEAAPGAVPATLSATTIGEALAFASAGPSAASAARALAEGILRDMLAARVGSGLIVLLAATLVAGGVVAAAQRGRPEPPPEKAPVAAAAAAVDLHGDPLPADALVRFGTLRFRAGSGIRTLAVFPDGKRLVAGGDFLLALDLATGRPAWELSQRAEALALAPDGKVLAVGTNSELVLREADTGREIGRFEQQVLPGQPALLKAAHFAGIDRVAFAPDGKLLASGGTQDHIIRLWDVASRRQVRSFHVGGNSRISGLAFTADGGTLVASQDVAEEALCAWDVKTGARRYARRGHGAVKESGHVRGLTMSPDGRTMATVGVHDTLIRLWDAASGEEKGACRGLTMRPYLVAFSPDGKFLVSSGCEYVPQVRDDAVRLWEVASGREVGPLKGQPHNVFALAFTPDGRTILTAGWDCCVRRWDAATRAELPAAAGHQGPVVAVAISLDGAVIATAGEDTVRLWDRASGRQLRQLAGHPGGVHGVAFAPDGKRLASAGKDRTIRLWDPHTGREMRRLDGHEDTVNAVAFSPDGTLLASGSDDQTTRVWDLATGKERRQLTAREPGKPPPLVPVPGQTLPPMGEATAGVTCVCFSPDGRLLASGCKDYAVRLWDAASGEQKAQLPVRGPVTALAWTPDSRRLVSASHFDEMIRLWDVASGREKQALEGHGHTIIALAVSPDGRRLASAGYEPETEIYLWDLESGKWQGRRKGHRGFINALAFTPDEKALVSGSRDTTALLWDVGPRAGRRSLRMTPEELERDWQALSNAYAPPRPFSPAMWRLASVPEQTVPFLARRLQPARLPKPVPALIADLSSDREAMAREAFEALAQLGDHIKPDLRKAAQGPLPPRAREMVAVLLEGLQTPRDAGALQAIELLRRIGTPAARAELKRLSGGAEGHWLTRAARAARDQLREAENRPGGASP